MKKLNEKNEIIDVICDCCGKSCKVEEFEGVNGNTVYQFEYLTLSNYWGYWSNKDLERWKAVLCEECVDTKLNFINFQKENYNPITGDKE